MHLAIIMDGNGRWASRRGQPRTAGHRAGVSTLQRIVEVAPGLGVTTLTVFAFSADNWRRPPAEVGALMGLLGAYLRSQLQRLAEAGIRLTVIGRRDRLAQPIVAQIAAAERATADGGRLHLRVAVDYSAREAIARAASCFSGPSSDELGRMIAHSGAGREDDGGATRVDLLIRTGGEKRLSDFLLWECAYAELSFLDVMWPDFTACDLAAAIADFSRRERRFGGLGSALPPLVAAAAAE